VTDQQFIAAIVNSLAWPVAVVVVAGLLRQELLGVIRRLQSLEFRGAKVTFTALPHYEKMIAAATKEAGVPAPEVAAVVRREATEFSVIEARASEAPRQAVIDAWGLLEYQLNIASDRIAPDQPHGWPQVARNLEGLDTWPLLYPAVLELRRLRDHTVQSSRPPSGADAARYVSVAQDVATAVQTSLSSQSSERSGGAK
jgi:hypothetical protein